MKISIITVCFNSEKTIEATIKSVIAQTYSHIEYIIIDGNSSDRTMRIIDKYKDSISIVVNEKDEGIYDAMNKGIQLATGDVIGILNSDDVYMSTDSIASVMEAFSSANTDAVYGDIQYMSKHSQSQVTRIWKAGVYTPQKLSYGWIPPHPAFFVKKQLYETYGVFDDSFTIAADYELMLRFLLKGISMVYVPTVIVSMTVGGHSASSFVQRRKGWQELKAAWQKNGRGIPPFFILRRVVSKFHQFI